MREITLSKAVNEAIAEEMRRDETVFLIGEDVAEAGTPFKVLSGLVEEFGTERVIDTPIAEPGFMGIAVGAAMTGARPIVDLMFGDFLYLIMDQLCNQAAKTHYMSGGKLKVPLVLRTNLGATRRSAAQHSQSLQALVAHIPGLKVALPSSAYEAKGLMKTAITRLCGSTMALTVLAAAHPNRTSFTAPIAENWNMGIVMSVFLNPIKSASWKRPPKSSLSSVKIPTNTWY